MRRDLIPPPTTSPGVARRRGPQDHTPWCGTRCRAGTALLGEHRSDPIVAIAGPVGGAAVTGTRVAQADGRQHLELRINIPLTGGDDHQRAEAADRALHAITQALAAATTPGPRTPGRNGRQYSPTVGV